MFNPSRNDTLVVFAVDFTSALHGGHAMHHLHSIGKFPSCEAAREAIRRLKQSTEVNGAAARAYLGFLFWPVACSEHLPPEDMWLDLNDQVPVSVEGAAT